MGKKRHTVKNTIISTDSKWILFLGGTFSGHNHDYNMLKEEFIPEIPWFGSIKTLVDLGYQGIQKDYDGDQINIPHENHVRVKTIWNLNLQRNKKIIIIV